MTMKLLLGGLLSFVFFSLLLYISQTRQYPQWDEHHYLSIAVRTLDAIDTKGIIGFADSIPISGNRQPAYSIIITLFLLLVGTIHTYKIALGINAILFCLSILGTYILARNFLGKTSSFIAALLFATFGNTLFYAHFTYVETAVTTMIVWTLVFLQKTKGFHSTSFSIICAIFFCIATLTRFVAPLFLLGPIIVVLLQTIFSKSTNHLIDTTRSSKLETRNWRNILLFVLISLLIPTILYFIPNREAFLLYVKNNQTYGAEWVKTYRDPVMANTFSLRSMTYYFNIIEQNTMGIFLLFAVGMVLLVKNVIEFVVKKKNISSFFSLLFLFTAFAVPYAFFTFIAVWKEDRFIVPIYPVVAIISAIFIEKLLHFRRLSITCITIIIFISFLNFLGALFGIGPMGQKGLVDYVTPRWLPHPRRIYLTPLVWPPTKEYSNAALFVRAIEQDWKGQDKARILLSFQHEPFTNAVTSILTYEKRNLATLTVIPNATTSSEFDYVATQQEFSDRSVLKEILIPYDSSHV